MSFIQSINNYNENGNEEYNWNDNLINFYFQLVRTKDYQLLENKYQLLLNKNIDIELLGKLILHTRDINNGKGEYQLAFMQLYYLSKVDLEYSKLILQKMISYGSWKDIKYLCKYLYEKENNHPLIKEAIKLLVNQLKIDIIEMRKGNKISLAGKWTPREKSSFGWLVPLILEEYKIHLIEYRKKIVNLNYYLKTLEITMCDKRWKDINFNQVCGKSLNKYRKGFLYINKKGNIKGNDLDRIECRENILNHLCKVKNGEKKLNTKTLNLYEIVKNVFVNSNNMNELDLLNTMWKENGKKEMNFGNLIPLCDVSASMYCDDNIPIYNAIGLSIRISEKNNLIFRNRILTFSSNPEWIELNDDMTLHQKILTLKNANWGMNTDFYKAMKLIIDVIKTNNISQKEIDNLGLIIFSDMQIDQSGYHLEMDNLIDKLFEEINMKRPLIIFWNLRLTKGLPTIENKNNVLMLSGYNINLINQFMENGIEGLKNYNPMDILLQVLNKY